MPFQEKKNDYYSKLRAAGGTYKPHPKRSQEIHKIPTDPTHAVANVSVFALWNGAVRQEGSGYHTDDCAIS